MATQWLQEKSWQDVEEYLKTDDRIIIPIGSTEQHGCFAALGTDTLVAKTIAEDASDKTGILVAPPVWYGWSPHHMVRPGTVTVRAEVLIELLSDVIESLADHGFKNFVVINGHRIVNISWMQIAAERAQRENDVKVVLFDPAFMSKEIVNELGFGPIGHAEDIEISHMLYRYPELVDIERAKDNPHAPKDLYHLDPTDGRDTLCYVPATLNDMLKTFEATGDTVGGSPTASSVEKGKKYHDHLVNRLIQVLDMFKEK